MDNSQEISNKTVKAIFRKDDLEDSLSTSDWGLVIDDNYKCRRRDRSVKLGEEPLALTCEWDSCNEYFTMYTEFNQHLEGHIENHDITEDEGVYTCAWSKCSYTATTTREISQHISYHGYHTKLKSVGQNVEYRGNLPQCTQTSHFVIPATPEGYQCQWEYCSDVIDTIYGFFEHMHIHIYHNPKGCKEGVVKCCWKGCTHTGIFTSQYRLAEHIRIHTKEKIIACPTCGNLFANKTKFCDHRKRQLPSNRQSCLCSQCSKSFPSERLLRDHMRLHINHYKCSMCEMTCPKPSTLAKHIRCRHLNEKPYQCNKCNYKCVSKHNLDLHIKKHNPDSQFKCSKCTFKCRSALGLERHCQKIHGKEPTKVFECHNCERKFSRGDLLTRHLMKIHDYHWPSGHTRFRYKADADGVRRLQTVRYETLDVTEEIMRGHTVQPPSDNESLKVDILKKEQNSNSVPRFDVVLSNRDEEQSSTQFTKKVVITIDDLDLKGNILKSQTIQSSEIFCSDMEEIACELPEEIIFVNPDEKPVISSS